MDFARIVRDIQRHTDEDQTALAKRLRVSQPTISRWLGGHQEPDADQRDQIIATAKSLGVIEYLNLDGRGTPIVGYVGAGGQVDYGEGQGPFGEAPMPPEATANTVAVLVRGESMSGQLENGWTVYYDDRRTPPTTDLLGKLCAVGLSSGTVLIKKLLPGRREGCFDLYSVNAPPMLDQPVEWAARITWIQPD